MSTIDEERIAVMDLIPGDEFFHEGSVCRVIELQRFDYSYCEVKFKLRFKPVVGGISKWKVFRAGTRLRLLQRVKLK